MPAKKVVWVCPKCGSKPNKHGKGKCEEGYGSRKDDCSGFLCECEADGGDRHGTLEEPCPEANCYHCLWGGEFPVPNYDPKKLTGWAKTAYKAGWRPPLGWKP